MWLQGRRSPSAGRGLTQLPEAACALGVWAVLHLQRQHGVPLPPGALCPSVTVCPSELMRVRGVALGPPGHSAMLSSLQATSGKPLLPGEPQMRGAWRLGQTRPWGRYSAYRTLLRRIRCSFICEISRHVFLNPLFFCLLRTFSLRLSIFVFVSITRILNF